MQHRLQIRAHMVHRSMERQLRRWLVLAYDRAIRLDADNVRTGKRTLVNTGRGDPDIPLFILNGQVTARCGGQALVINALHKHDQLVSRVNVLNIHKTLLNSK